MIDFSEKYNREEILKFLHNDFLKDFQKDIRKVNVPEGKFIKSAFSLGSSKDLDLGVFEFEHTGSTEKKVTLTKEAFKILRDSGYFKALAFFHSEDTDDWRFSLMTITPTLTEKGKIKKEFSNPKRFSFLLGPRAKVNTPTQFLIKKGQIESLEDLKERFSIEVVNKEFYTKISELFVELVGGELGTGRSKVKYEGLLELPGVKPASKEAQEFAVRLIGRLIFCWFLREKKNGSEDSLMPSSLLSYEASKENNNYYHEVLEPIFFKVLNVPIDSRKEEKYATDPYAQVPYLNGGLFTPHEDDYFSNMESKQKEYRKVVRVRDKWIQKLFEILETYNFTIDENSSFNEELSIDPEMLGRIFENLLAEINPETGESARKSTGSFYTPRVIVDYMVDESLYLYLQEKTGIKEEKLRALISYDLDDDEDSPLDTDEKEKIINAIDELKILDPACGSGAFPMGALQKIVFILQQLDPNGQYWFKAQIKNVPVELRKNLEREHSEKNFDYIRKLGVIRRNIFGVDIQPIATEISRLRCFLTLIVDQKVDDNKDNRGIDPLPNLDFKFVTANSLISLPENENSKETIGMFEDTNRINELKDIRDQFFNASNFERIELKDQFRKIQLEMSKYYNTVKSAGAELTEMLLSWDPFSHNMTEWFDPEWMFGIKDGFDIVIGNPPYETSRNSSISDRMKEYIKEQFEVAEDKYDYYVLFMELSSRIAANTGIIALITPSTYMLKPLSKKIRKFLLEKHEVISIDEFKGLVFKAVVPTSIIFFRKKNQDFQNEISVAYDIRDIEDFIFKRYPKKKLNQRVLCKEPYFYINIYAEENFWEVYNRVSMMSGFMKLGELAEIYNGIQTGRDKKYVSEEKKSDKWEKVIVGSDIDLYYKKWGGKYVHYIPKELHSNTRQEIFKAKEKIIIRQTSDRIIGTYDNEKYFTLASTFNIVQFTRRISYKSLLAILNSKLFLYFYRNINNEAGRVLPQIKKKHIFDLPICIDIDDTELINLVDQALVMRDKIEDGNKLEFREILKHIDGKIYDIYGLSKEEIRVIEESPLIGNQRPNFS